MRFRKNANAAKDADKRILKPFLVSLAGHLILFGVILFNPEWSRKPDEYFPSVIDVRMVDLTDAGGAPAKNTEIMENAPIETEAQEEEAAEAETPAPETEVKPEISISESKPKYHKKTALKYKTFKSKKVLKSALDKLEKKIEKTPPRPLEDALKRIREDVAEKEKGDAGGGVSGEGGNSQSKSDTYAPGSKREIEAIDLYMLDIQYRVKSNWAFSEQLAGRNQKLMASLVFKVLPDGQIEDIFFTDRSGNQYLDDSAMKAIIKSSPVMPHPKGVNQPYVQMGLRFTPKGVY